MVPAKTAPFSKTKVLLPDPPMIRSMLETALQGIRTVGHGDGAAGVNGEGEISP
jgi:hypothetical protein